MRRWLAIVTAFVAVGIVACGNPGDANPLGNVGPRARLMAPLSAPVGTPVVFDAGASFDPDGTVAEYTFSFTDGSRQVTLPTPEITHIFTQPGAYEVAVVVKDGGGALARATQLVIVRSDPPACQATADCSLGAECRDHLCYVVGAGSGAGLADCRPTRSAAPGSTAGRACA